MWETESTLVITRVHIPLYILQNKQKTYDECGNNVWPLVCVWDFLCLINLTFKKSLSRKLHSCRFVVANAVFPVNSATLSMDGSKSLFFMAFCSRLIYSCIPCFHLLFCLTCEFVYRLTELVLNHRFSERLKHVEVGAVVVHWFLV